jgi:hypothetical protein
LPAAHLAAAGLQPVAADANAGAAVASPPTTSIMATALRFVIFDMCLSPGGQR